MQLNLPKKLSAGALYHISVKKFSSADVKTFFFWSSSIFSGKLTQGAISSQIFEKEAIVQKRLKIPGLRK